jgi:hypothetical protein
MFFPGSRYRNLPESSPIDASGQRLRGKVLRVNPLSTGHFLHTVQDHDRLDLLAFKFYGDALKWWQICDANPEFAFPNDLLNQTPIIEERLSLVSPGADTAFSDLVRALEAFGTVRLTVKDLVALTVVVFFASPDERGNILKEIASRNFKFLGSFGWTKGGGLAEAFTVEDRNVKMRWRQLLEDFEQLPGVLELTADSTGPTVRLVYNSAVTSHLDIQAAVSQSGFAIVPQSSQTLERIGQRIVVPPNEIS